MAQSSLTKLIVGQPTAVRHQHTLVAESFLGKRLLISSLIAELVQPAPEQNVAPRAIPPLTSEHGNDGPGARS